MKALFRYALLAMLIIMNGCGQFRIPVRTDDPDTGWMMEGKNPGHLSETQSDLRPPLRLRWSAELPAGFGASAVAVSDTFLFVSTWKGEVRCLGLAGGADLGSRAFGSAIGGTPAIDSGVLFVAAAKDSASLFSYDLRTGRQLWRASPGAIGGSPVIIGDNCIVGTLSGTVQCFDKKTGVPRWRYHIPRGPRHRLLPGSPACSDSVVIAGCDDGELVALNLADGRLLWNVQTGSGISASPVIAEGMIITVSPDSTCRSYDVKNGRMVWSSALDAAVYAAPAAAPGAVVTGTSAGSLWCLDIRNGTTRWKTGTGAPIGASPVIGVDVVYAGNLGRRLAAVDLGTGRELWSDTVGGRIRSAPVLAHGFLVVPGDNRTVYTFGSAGGR